MALRALVKAESRNVFDKTAKTSAAILYRSMIRELPRVLTIYDMDTPIKDARAAIAAQFRKNGFVKDSRVATILIAKGYMELEETLKQWKQRSHLARILEPPELQPIPAPLTEEEELKRFNERFE